MLFSLSTCDTSLFHDQQMKIYVYEFMVFTDVNINQSEQMSNKFTKFNVLAVSI